MNSWTEIISAICAATSILAVLFYTHEIAKDTEDDFIDVFSALDKIDERLKKLEKRTNK